MAQNKITKINIKFSLILILVFVVLIAFFYFQKTQNKVLGENTVTANELMNILTEESNLLMELIISITDKLPAENENTILLKNMAEEQKKEIKKAKIKFKEQHSTRSLFREYVRFMCLNHQVNFALQNQKHEEIQKMRKNLSSREEIFTEIIEKFLLK